MKKTMYVYGFLVNGAVCYTTMSENMGELPHFVFISEIEVDCGDTHKTLMELVLRQSDVELNRGHYRSIRAVKAVL